MRSNQERERVRDRLSAMTGDVDSPAVPEWLLDGGDDEADGSDEDARFSAVPERWRGMRWSPHRRGAVALVIIAVAAAGFGVFALWWDSPTIQAVPVLPAAVGIPVATSSSAPPTTVDSAPTPVPASVVVSVVGLVHSPGLVTLPDSARVADALSAAGGVLDNADTLSLNLAQKLSDGDQVVVGAVGDSPHQQTSSTTASTAAGAPVNLNTATEAELDALPGVGPVTASAILAWRTSNGKFTDVEQLGEVDGIGPARLDKLRALVTV
ncbi:helix-hairpin-helix domain-containing protein [Rhodococcus sp. NPDC056743]|uniref:helix-hairpin-helix domain-containing protein n=1 Tax=Rhodococcus sp. NPDC056743 TaxID=3345934 RepID=UPI00366B32D0